MHIKYILATEKSLVFNEKEEITKRKTTKNLEKILKQENKIRLIENQLRENKIQVEKSKSKEKSFKRQAIWLCPLGVIAALLAGDVFLTINFIVLHIENVNMIWTFQDVLKDMLTFNKVMSIIGTIFSSILSLFCLSIAKQAKENLESTELKSFFLENDLEKEQEELAKLKADNQPLEIEKEETKPIYIDNQRMINQYREYLTKLSFYGEKLKKYNKMLERDKDKLRNQMNFDGIDIDLFETYIKSRKKRKW